MSAKNKNPFITNKPRKKLWWLWFIWIPLILIGVLTIIPSALAMALFFDTGHNDTGLKPEDAMEPTQLFNGVTNELFDGCRETTDPNINIVIKQRDLNRVFLHLQQDVNTQVQAKTNLVSVNQIDIQLVEDGYIFNMEASALGFFKTRATVYLTVQTDVIIPGTSEEGIIFKIKDAKVGRLGDLQGLVSSFVDLGEVLSSLELSWVYNKQESALYYTYTNIKNDLTSKMSLSSELLDTLFNTFFDEDLVHFGHNTEGIGASIPLSRFIKDATYCCDELTIAEKKPGTTKLMINETADNVQMLLNADVINQALADAHSMSLAEAARSVHVFLMFGKDFLSASQLALINSIYSTTQMQTLVENRTIDDYSEYRKNSYFGTIDDGIVDRIKDEAVQKASDLVGTSDPILAYETYQKIKASLANDEHNNSFYLYGGWDLDGNPQEKIHIYDSDIHSMISATEGIIGYGFPFVSQDTEGQWKYSYTMVDNIYASSITGESGSSFALIFGLNINGTETSLILPAYETTFSGDTNVFGMSFSIADSVMSYGEVQIASLKDTLGSIMNSLGESSNSFITYEKDGSGDLTGFTFKLDLNSILTGSGDFARFHENMTSNDPLNPLACNADLFVNIAVEANADHTYGLGGLSIEVGYKARS